MIKKINNDVNETKEDGKESSPHNALYNEQNSGNPIQGVCEKLNLGRMGTEKQLRVEAYTKELDRNSSYIALVTWSTLFSLEVMNIAYDGLIETLKEDGIYKGECKYIANQVKLELDKFMGNIHRTCYNGDEHIVIEEAREYEIDIFKLKLSISNYLHKFKVNHNASCALIKVCQGLTDLIQVMHDNKRKEIKKMNPNLDFSDFMNTRALSYKIKSLSEYIYKIYNKNVGEVNLNDDICVMNGIYSLNNKINNLDTIKNLIIKIYENDNRSGKERK